MNKKTLLKSILFLSLFVLQFQALLPDQAITLASDEKTLFKKISNINMRSFEYEDNYWSCNSFVEWMQKYRIHRFNPQVRSKRADINKLFEEIEKKDSKTTSLSLNDEGTWLDLDLFAGKKPKAPFLAYTIDRTVTEYGTVKLMWMLAQPTDDREILLKRQHVIQTLSQDPVFVEKLQYNLVALQKAESIFVSCWDRDQLKESIERESFSLKLFQDSRTALMLGNYYTHTSNITTLSFASFTTGALSLYGFLRLMDVVGSKQFDEAKKDYQAAGGFLMSYLWKKFEQRWPENKGLQTTFALVSAVMCGLSIKKMVDHIHGQYLFDLFIQDVMLQIAQSINALREINNLLLQHPQINATEAFKPLHDLFVSKDKKIQELLGYMKSSTLRDKSSFFSHKGTVIRAFMLFHEIKNELVLAINAVAELDVYCSFVKLQQEFSTKNVHWCFADYVQADKPMIEAKNFWHPMVNVDVVVPNSVTLGTQDYVSNLVITGPNAGGKSTILKSLALCILLSQTFGIAPAEQFKLTPFSSIATYLNITDDIGAGNSLYKAEVMRVVELIKRIENLEQGKFSFALFDEVFNRTSPHEGSAAAYSVMDDMAKKENSINLVATHFALLTKLAEHNNRVANYKVSVNVQEDGQIVYPFKLEPGISHQHVAIDILRNEGVSSHILDQAQVLLRSITF